MGDWPEGVSVRIEARECQGLGEVAEAAIHVARRLGCSVVIMLNGVELRIVPTDTRDAVLGRFGNALGAFDGKGAGGATSS